MGALTGTTRRLVWRSVVGSGVLTLLALGCVHQMQRTVVEPDALRTVDGKAQYLKVHMRDGSLYVLSPWNSNDAEQRVSGRGTHFAVDRSVVARDSFSISLDSVALFETNSARPSEAVAVMAVITGVSVALTIHCMSNPKSCFGSCPTFYVSDGTRDVLQAEGFSASIAPSLEARDVDALYRARADGGEVRVTMRNEAYETHVVRYANLLAVPRTADQRALHDDAGGFWAVTAPVAPSRCQAAEGDCGVAVAAFDGRERWSGADSTNLGARETIDLEFDAMPASPALVLASRQSLLPTYLLYQAFAWLGSSVGQWIAALERRDPLALQRRSAVVSALGGIDVLVPDGAGGWDSVATIRETGPLAADVRLVRLPAGRPYSSVRLRLAKGAWRIDHAAITSVRASVQPLRLQPTDVFQGRKAAPAARASLLDPDSALVTFPGDDYTLVYQLPRDGAQYDLFLESRGYYLEWMREQWIAEENPARAAALFLAPERALRDLAPQFKREEAELDSAFWRSKYARH